MENLIFKMTSISFFFELLNFYKISAILYNTTSRNSSTRLRTKKNLAVQKFQNKDCLFGFYFMSTFIKLLIVEISLMNIVSNGKCIFTHILNRLAPPHLIMG